MITCQIHWIQNKYIFFFKETSTTKIYTLSLHDALPIFSLRRKRSSPNVFEMAATETITSIILIKLIMVSVADRKSGSAGMPRPISYAVFCLKKKKKKAQLSL